MREAFLRYWRGILLAAVGVLATFWLEATGRLGLYIHPRYFVFAGIMAGIAGVLVIAALVQSFRGEGVTEHDHGHGQDHGHDDDIMQGTGDDGGSRRSTTRRRPGRVAVIATTVLIATSAVALLALPPAALSPALAGGQSLTANAAALSGSNAQQVMLGDPATFTVKDWAVIIDGATPDGYLDTKTPSVDGFVVSVSADRFAVTRYVITCCVVDAQPVGLTVAMEGWASQFKAGQWVHVTGKFVADPDPAASSAWVIQPTAVTPIAQPSDPYIH